MPPTSVQIWPTPRDVGFCPNTVGHDPQPAFYGSCCKQILKPVPGPILNISTIQIFFHIFSFSPQHIPGPMSKKQIRSQINRFRLQPGSGNAVRITGSTDRCTILPPKQKTNQKTRLLPTIFPFSASAPGKCRLQFWF